MRENPAAGILNGSQENDFCSSFGVRGFPGSGRFASRLPWIFCPRTVILYKEGSRKQMPYLFHGALAPPEGSRQTLKRRAASWGAGIRLPTAQGDRGEKKSKGAKFRSQVSAQRENKHPVGLERSEKGSGFKAGTRAGSQRRVLLSPLGPPMTCL